MDFSNFTETKDDESEELVFHYNRQNRIQKAPQIVQDYYSGELKAFKPGLFKALVSTKGNKLIFFVLIICFFVVIIEGVFNKKNTANFNGIPIELSSFSFEETVYVSVEFGDKSKKSEESNNLPVTATISFLDADKMPVEKVILNHFYQEKKSFLRTTYHDYDIFYILAELNFGEKQISLLTNVEKR